MKGYERGMRTSVIGWCLGIAAFAFVVGILPNGTHAHAAETQGAFVGLNHENFPDDYFRGVVAENFDKDKNGILDGEEIKAATELKFRDEMEWSGVNQRKLKQGVTDFKGIEYLTELQELDYGGEGCGGGNIEWNNPD